MSKKNSRFAKIFQQFKEWFKLTLAVIENICIFGLSRTRHISKKAKGENIIIVGGELFNKGAQAMTFAVIDEMRRRFPEKAIYLLSDMDYRRKDKDKDIYNFNILPWDFEIKINLLNVFLDLIKKLIGKKCDTSNYMKNIFKNSIFCIDISGYALSSQWGRQRSIDYLLNIAVAKKFSIPYYIFPQSIGPFNYHFLDKLLLYPLLKIYLKYPLKIFSRENEGLHCIQRFTRQNAEKSYDLVLQTERYELSNIYIHEPHLKNIAVEPNSVAIIPNSRVIERSDAKNIYSIYNSLIGRLISASKPVYILRHSSEDLNICEKIKTYYANNRNIKLIPDDFSTIELENIIKQFDFLIASRYHAIIQAYKNGISALVIGWATKYFELLNEFGQLDYFFDVRSDLDTHKIVSSLDKLISGFLNENEKINNRMKFLMKKDIFSILN